jgi:hypothetical protein
MKTTADLIKDLQNAANNGRINEVQNLLENPEVKAGATANDNAALGAASSRGHTDIIKLLLGIDAVKAEATANTNFALRAASANGHIEIVKLLLGIDAVKAQAAAGNNTALRLASKNGHTEIVKLLVSIDAVKLQASTDYNFALRFASENGHTEIVKLLLKIRSVKDAITANIHEALREASDKKHWDVVSVLLQHYGNHSIPLSIIKSVLTIPDNHATAEEIRKLALNRTITVGDAWNSMDTFNAWIAHWNLTPWPDGVTVNAKNWCDYLYAELQYCEEPREAAIILLSLSEQSKIHQRWIAENAAAAGGGESAMETSLVAMVANHYRDEVQSKFAAKFNELGGVDGIEKRIKALLLDKIIEHANEPLKAEIIQRKDNILNGIEADILWAREQFTAPNDIYQTAWRAYDSGAKTVGWKNLLTAPSTNDAHESTFTIAETGSGAVDLQASSDIIRSMAAHYYLVAMDERLTPDERNTAIEAFIAAIAEIRRAHNDNPQQVGDNPSCFPGCFTRLYEVTKRNSHITNIKPGLVATLNEVYINELEKSLVRAFIACDEQTAYRLCDALTMLRGPGKDIAENTAWDVISNPDKVMCNSRMNEEGNEDDFSYNADLLKMRLEFLAKIMPLDVVKVQLQAVMLETHQMNLEGDDLVLVQALLADIGGKEAGFYITSACEKRIEALNANVVVAPSGLVRHSVVAPVIDNEPGTHDIGSTPRVE